MSWKEDTGEKTNCQVWESQPRFTFWQKTHTKKETKQNWKNTLTWQQQIRHFLLLYLNVPLLSCAFVIWLEHKMHLFALLLQNMFGSDEDNGDASVYEMMCTAGEWRTDGKWKEDKGKPVMELCCWCVFFFLPPAHHYVGLLFISDHWIFSSRWWAHHVALLPISCEMTVCRSSSCRHSSNSTVNTFVH